MYKSGAQYNYGIMREDIVVCQPVGAPRFQSVNIFGGEFHLFHHTHLLTSKYPRLDSFASEYTVYE